MDIGGSADPAVQTTTSATGAADRPAAAPGLGQRSRRFGPVEALILALLGLILARGPIADVFSAPRAQTFSTVFVAILVQATPFLVLGVLLSAVIAVYVPASFFARVLPRRPVLAVPAASAAGVVLPGCECGSVPIASALMRRGVTPAAAVAFLLSAPAVNPVVLASTALAFPGEPAMVAARAGASLVAASAMGWLWLRLGRPEWIRMPRRPDPALGRGRAFLESCRHDIAHAGGFLVIGAAAAAAINVFVPGTWLQSVADKEILAIIALAALAVALSICSEADAFVAASLTQFSLTSRLVFLVVGPMVDLKLFAMQTGFFGRSFSLRFAPATLLVATVAAAVIGTLVWGW
jgi:uncharacterized membrane protein YraQ (UPF0718 family)